MGRPEEIEFAQLLFGGIGIMVMMALAIVIFVLLYQRKLHFQQRSLHQMEMSHQKKILESIVASQENERERIARDLHDEVGASLSAVRLFVNQIQYEKSPEEMKGLAARSGQILGDVVKDVRQIAHNLSPVIIENFGFAGAVKILLNRMEDAGMHIHCSIDDPAETLSAYQQTILYRIIQEVIGNVVKHAEASEITFDLHQNGPHLILQMGDNGKGFDVASGHKQTGMGMSTIRTRTDLLDAKLILDSAPGAGTRIKIDIPL
ncbi:sensor histidine kinase [Dyadobacter sp. CY261]|uniref:sensor histidine kinase n=1 Tax=Dyadobacter sp. CY261 TaxID=2907203 RepID=UPI001F1A0F8B|nr:sensor histidine kinase [Dyadobacter sp. CY261]MCF0072486.1 sensor histidine kinase [Dyadobacter sp. CY261]